VTLADAQDIYLSMLPATLRAGVDPKDLVLQANVYAAKGEDPDAMARLLNNDVPGILATGPTKMMDTVRGLIGMINGVVWSVAAIALIVCALSIVNTMTTAVGERTREIGVKRALGASRWRIARDVLAESAVIGGLGGIVGVAVGVAVALGLNAGMVAATGSTLFVVTGRLVLGTALFAVVLGTVGGLYPARAASRLDPAAALSHE
jgi:putative ABC transport system permease protein